MLCHGPCRLPDSSGPICQQTEVCVCVCARVRVCVRVCCCAPRGALVWGIYFKGMAVTACLYWALRGMFQAFPEDVSFHTRPHFYLPVPLHILPYHFSLAYMGSGLTGLPPTPLERHSSRQMKTKTKSYCVYLSPDTHTTWVWKGCAKKSRGGKGWLFCRPWALISDGRHDRCTQGWRAEMLSNWGTWVLCFLFLLAGRQEGRAKDFFFFKQQHIIM